MPQRRPSEGLTSTVNQGSAEDLVIAPSIYVSEQSTEDKSYGQIVRYYIKRFIWLALGVRAQNKGRLDHAVLTRQGWRVAIVKLA